jgi:hypothetical protein
MSLDITILGADGFPKRQVSIRVDDHYRLTQLVGKSGLLARLNDYYTDAEFENAELDSLVREVTALRERCRDDERLVSFLNGVVGLAELAKREQRALLAIAD